MYACVCMCVFVCMHLCPSGLPSDRPGLPLLSVAHWGASGVIERERERGEKWGLPTYILSHLHHLFFLHNRFKNVVINTEIMFCLS